jgi:hypothetical protein
MYRSPSPSGRLLLAALVLAVLAVVTGCSGDLPRPDAAAGTATTSRSTSGTAGPTPSVRTTRFGVVGDSLTAGADHSLGTDPHGPGSWLPAAIGEPLEFSGGWAVAGAGTADMLAGVEPVDADVLVVLAGTNDVLDGVPWEASRANLLAIVGVTGVDDVLVVAIPPLDSAPVAAAGYDHRLAELAGDEGWQYLDPWTAVSDAGRWVSGASPDGIHPTQLVADEVGQAIRTALLDRVTRAPRSPR